MPLIERISQLQEQGLKEDEVIQRLREEGVSPNEIDEALEQSKVKSAVFENRNESEPSLMYSVNKEDGSIVVPDYNQLPSMQPTPSPQAPLTQARMQETQEMQPMPPTQMEAYPEDTAYQEETAGQQEANYPSTPRGEAYPEYQAPTQALDAGAVTEIIEQIIEEKTEKLQNQIFEISKFRAEVQGRIINIDERIRRIEMIIDRLQISILKEIGNYGRNISELKKEMLATQDSFSKILNPLSENIKELRKITGEAAKTSLKEAAKTEKKEVQEKTTETIKKEENKNIQTTEKTKSKDGFEGYLRK